MKAYENKWLIDISCVNAARGEGGGIGGEKLRSVSVGEMAAAAAARNHVSKINAMLMAM